MKFKFIDKRQFPGMVFVIDHYHQADPTKSKVWLKCITDKNLMLSRYIDLSQLELV